MQPIALIVVNLRDRRIDRDLVEVRPSQSSDLRIDVRMNTSCEQRIVGEVEARHDVRGAEGYLLRLCEEVIRVSVQDHATHRPYGYDFLRNKLGRIENVEGELLCLRF